MVKISYKSGHGSVLSGKETTFGTPVVVAKDLGVVQNISTTPIKNVKKIFGIGQTAVVANIQGRFETTGSIEVAYQHGRLLEYIFGTVAHDAADTPDIKHTFTVNDTLPSMTLQDGSDSTTDTLLKTSVKLGTLTINVNGIDDEITLSTDYLGKKPVTDTTVVAKVISTLETLSGAQATFKIGGSAVDEVQNCNMTINRASTFLHGISDQDVIDVQAQEFSVDFTATIGFKDKAEVDRLLASTVFAVELDITNGIAAASGLRQLNIVLANGVYSETPKTTTVGDFVFMDISGTGTINTCHTYDNIVEGNW